MSHIIEKEETNNPVGKGKATASSQTQWLGFISLIMKPQLLQISAGFSIVFP